MSSIYCYKFYGRLGTEKEQLIRPVDFPENMFVELAEVKKEFGERWELWIERFHRIHPHAALQRRIDGFATERRGGARHAPLRIEKHEGHVAGWIDPQFNPNGPLAATP